MKRKTLFMAIRLGVVLSSVIASVSLVDAQEAAATANITPCIGHHPYKTAAQNKDDETTPRVLYETEPVAQGAWKTRKHVAPGGISPADGTNDSGGIIDFDENPVGDIPAAQSNIILIGTVTDSKAYLVNNKTGIYSEYTFQTESVLKNDTGQILHPGSTIDGTRSGGVVQFPSGKCIRARTAGKGSLELKGQYLVFLKKIDEGDFNIMAGYLFKDGAVYPLDGAHLALMNFNGPDKHTGQNIQAFLDEVTAAIGSN